MKKLILILALITLSNTIYADPSPVSLAELLAIQDDINKFHEGRPLGIPSDWNYALRPELGAGNNLGNYRALTSWGVVYNAAGTSITTNHFQLKNLITLVCHGNPVRWDSVQNNRIDGYQYKSNWSDDTHKVPSVYLRTANYTEVYYDYGQVFHFWPDGNRATVPSDSYCGILAVMQAREVGSSGQDTTGTNSYLLGIGADYWLTLNADYNGYNRNNTEIVDGRLKFLKGSWSWYGVTTASINNLTLLSSNGYDNGGVSTPPPPPTPQPCSRQDRRRHRC